MRKFLCGVMTFFLLMTLTGLPAYGYGGGDGGGGGGGDLGTSMTDFGNQNAPPEGFTPIVIGQPSPAPDPEFSSVGATPVTNETRELSPEELERLQAAFDVIVVVTVTGGGIVLGYSTAAAGWSVLGQAAASGAYAGVTTFITSGGEATDESVRAALQDFMVGFIPVPPPAQAGISYLLTKNREQHANDKEPSLSELRGSFDPHYAW